MQNHKTNNINNSKHYTHYPALLTLFLGWYAALGWEAGCGGGMLGGQLTDALKDTAKSTGMLFGGLASPPK